MNREYARKPRFVAVDINALSVEELAQLRDILKRQDRAQCEVVNEMISWECGFMTTEHSREYWDKHVSLEGIIETL
jgi:hypothetical protein